MRLEITGGSTFSSSSSYGEQQTRKATVGMKVGVPRKGSAGKGIG